MMITSQKTKSRHNTVQGACSILLSGSHALWRFIPLTQGKFAIVDAENYEWLNQWKWCAVRNKRTFYAIRTVRTNGKKTTISMHREILQAPKGSCTDHKNHKGCDNRRYNLRICTYSQNSFNRKPNINSSSKYKGVSWRKDCKKWQAIIEYNGKKVRLGYSISEIECAKKYDSKARQLFGEFAYINF